MPLHHGPQALDRFRQQATVEVEADGCHGATLLRPQEVAGAADLQVAQGDLEAGPQLGGLEDGLEALLGGLRQAGLAVVDQVGVGQVCPSAHATAKLVDLGQPQLVGLVDDDGVDVGDVEARFDDGGAGQHVDAPVHEVEHHLLQLVLRHLAVGDGDLRLGHDLPQMASHVVDALHAVVDEVDLAAAVELAQDGLADEPLVELRDVGLDRQALLGRRLHGGHVADAAQGHVQSAGDRRGRERQHTHLAPHLLQALLVGHPESLLLVDDHEAQVLELHVLLDEAVGADDDVHRPRGEVGYDLALLGLGAEAR